MTCPLHHLCQVCPPGAPPAGPTLRQIKLRRGEHLFRVADVANQHLHIIRKGDIKLYQHGHDGGPHIIEFAGPGDWLGLESLDQPQRRAGAVALTDCELATVPYTELVPLPGRPPCGATAFARVLSGTIVRHRQHTAMLRNTSAQQRVAQFLLHRLDRAQGVARATLPMSRQDIADYLGLTSPTVSRCLSALRRRGWLATGQRAYALPGLHDVALVAAGAALPPDR